MEAAKALQYIHWIVGNNVVNVVEDAVKTEAEVEVVTTEEFLVTTEAEVVTKKLEMAEKRKKKEMPCLRLVNMRRHIRNMRRVQSILKLLAMKRRIRVKLSRSLAT
ncbi:hypothetical protein Droror1_Dr00008020 [Drosera rotundifolia]